MTTPQHPHDLVGKARVRVFAGALGYEDHVMAEGDVIAYCDVPTLVLRHDDGTRSSWNVTLRREVVGPFGGTPDVLPPSESEREEAAYERGVAEGRRQATEGWERKWGVWLSESPGVPAGVGDNHYEDEVEAREMAEWFLGLGWTEAKPVSRLVGPWETAEQATPVSDVQYVDEFQRIGASEAVILAAELAEDDAHMAAMEERHQHEAEQDGADRG